MVQRRTSGCNSVVAECCAYRCFPMYLVLWSQMGTRFAVRLGVKQYPYLIHWSWGPKEYRFNLATKQSLHYIACETVLRCSPRWLLIGNIEDEFKN